MRYNTRSLDCEIIFDKKVDCEIIFDKKVDKSVKKKKKSEKINKYIKKEKKLKEVAKHIKKKKKSKKVNNCIKKEKKSRKVNKYIKKEKNSKEIEKKEKKSKNVTTKFKEKFLIKNKLSMLKNWNKCFYFINKSNEWERTKPCFVILEKINVKQFRSNIAPKVYIKRELDQNINFCTVNLERINVKQCMNNNELLKPCSVILNKCDSAQKSNKSLYKVKQEIVDCDEDLNSYTNPLSHSSENHPSRKNLEGTTERFKIKQEIEWIDEATSSFNSSLDPCSVQHETGSAITNVTESHLCLEQEKKKRFKDSNNVVEILCNDYFCTHCNKVLPSKKALYYHICSNKLKKGFLCEICFKYFDFYHLLTKHKCSRSLPLSCSVTVKNRRKGSPSPFYQFPTSRQSFRESNKFECVSSAKYCKLKENNPPNSKKNVFLKNPACASTSSGYCSSTLEFRPYLWQSDESDNGL